MLYLEDRNRAMRRTSGMDDFFEFVDGNDLINLFPFQGPSSVGLIPRRGLC